MTDFEIAANIRDLSGDLVLALEDEANGYWIRRGGLPAEERHWIRRETRSPFVDGASVDGATLDQADATVLVKVFGSSWAQVETRYRALLAATTAPRWLFEQVVEGVSTVWRAGPVDVVAPEPEPADFLNKRRFVVLTFTVQPTPAVSGV